MLKKIISPFCVIASALWSAFISIGSLPFYAVSYQWGQVWHHMFGKGWIFFMGIKVTSHGRENIPPKGTGMVVAPNHESMFDVPLMTIYNEMDLHWMAKDEVRKIPFVAQALKAMGCYFVKRNRSEHDLNIMKEVEDGLKKGDAVLIFPEGTRTRTGNLLPFKKGAFRAAQNAGVPILPVAISGTYQIAKPGKWPEFGHSVTVRFGKPFHIKPDDNIHRVMEEYREILIKLLSLDR